MLFAIALAAAVAGTDPASPPQPASTPPTTVSAANVDAPKEGDKIICRNEPITGSRFIKRVCLKKFQWDQRDRDTEQFQQGMQDRTGIVGQRSTNPFSQN